MDEAKDTAPQKPRTDAARRAERLQAALRDNLRRRKAAAANVTHEKETPEPE